METHEWTQVQQDCHQLARYARDRVTELTGLSAVIPDDPKWFAQMALLPIPPCDGGRLKNRLLQEYGVELPVTGHGEQQFLRASLQGYNTRKDIDRLMEGLTALLPEVAT